MYSYLIHILNENKDCMTKARFTWIRNEINNALTEHKIIFSEQQNLLNIANYLRQKYVEKEKY